MQNAGKISDATSVRKRGGGSRHVLEVLRDEILELRLAPGTALDETALAARFAMSRSPVREALIRLSAVGLVQMLPNRSTIVAPLDIATLPRFVEAVDYLQRATTRLAARHRSEADLAAMTQAACDYDALCPGGKALALSEANKVFHMTIAHAGGNRYLAQSYERLLDEGRRILHFHFAHVRKSGSEFPLSPEHHRMVEAIKARDEAEADRLAHNHTRVFEDRIRDFMKVTYLEQPDLSGDMA
ncbi:GntR family transcriptional regulator [Marinovum sp.]|uniref:GntR family transcriptional regulator n=1 Tax=Marinovum sp. TaxID=2024839 RepID=UPI002B26D2D1|nr:GntR family transcriptional regulator [Marinovum sp.]